MASAVENGAAKQSNDAKQFISPKQNWILVAKDDKENNLYIQLLDAKKKPRRFELVRDTDLEDNVYRFTVHVNGIVQTVYVKSMHKQCIPFSAESKMYFESLLDTAYANMQ